MITHPQNSQTLRQQNRDATADIGDGAAAALTEAAPSKPKQVGRLHCELKICTATLQRRQAERRKHMVCPACFSLCLLSAK
jgi:hypothetical protein